MNHATPPASGEFAFEIPIGRARLACEKPMRIVPGAAHRFEEPGALPPVAALACDGFVRFLAPAGPGAA
jgi:hypothetical protein